MENVYLKKSIHDRTTTVVETGKRSWVTIILMVLLFASIISPQLSNLGRGLKLSLPLFFILIILMLNKKEKIFLRLLEKEKKYIFVGFIFVTNGLIRYLLDPVDTISQNYVISSSIIVMLWIAIVFLRAQSPKTIETIRWVTLLAISVSVGLGIPLLYNQPGVARLTMGNPLERTYIAIYYPKGIAEYSLYTAIAIAWPAIANWLLNYKPRLILFKWIGWTSLAALMIAVLFSTFSMALLLLLVGIVMWLLVLIFKGKSKKNALIAFLFLLLLAYLFPRLYSLGESTAATEYSTNKISKLITTTINEGFLAGDETGRVQMLVDTLPTILDYPLFGAWGFDKNMYFGGTVHGGIFWPCLGFLAWLYGFIFYLLH